MDAAAVLSGLYPIIVKLTLFLAGQAYNIEQCRDETAASWSLLLAVPGAAAGLYPRCGGRRTRLAGGVAALGCANTSEIYVNNMYLALRQQSAR